MPFSPWPGALGVYQVRGHGREIPRDGLAQQRRQAGFPHFCLL